MDQIEGPWSPEEDEMLQNLFEKHGDHWIRISESIPGRSAKSCEDEFQRVLFDRLFYMPEEHETIFDDPFRGRNFNPTLYSLSGRVHEDIKNQQNSTNLKWRSSSMTEYLNMNDPDIFIQSPSVNDINGGQRNSFIHDLTLRLALGGVSDQAPSIGDMPMETGSQNIIHQGNSSHVVGGMVSGPAPSIGDMAMETGSQYSIHQGNSSHEAGGAVSGQAPSISDMDMETESQNSIHQGSSSLEVRGVVSGQAPSIGDMVMEIGSQNSIHQGNSSHEIGGVVSGQAPSIGDMAMETGSQNSIHQGNSSHEVGGVVSGQPPSISNMARANMSSGGTHSYSRDHSAPSRNALYKRDSSPMMIDSDNVQELVGGEFGRKSQTSDLSSNAPKHVAT